MLQKGFFLSLSVFTTLSFSFNCFSQEKDSSLTIAHELQPIEVRAVRTTNNAPFATTEVGKKEIEANNLGQDIPYLLQNTPSAVVTSDAGAGVGYTGLRIRGTDGTRINVTLNGIPMNDAESQGTYFVDFADLASSTNSIQIQRGVGTSTNGAGAFGATMSISNLQLNNEAGASVNLSTGSFNTQKYTVKASSGLLQGGWQFDVRLSKIVSDGFINRSSSDLKSLQINAGWKINEKTSLRGMIMTGTEKTGQAWNGVPEEKLRGNDSALMSHYLNNIGVLYFNQQDSLNLFQSDPRKYNGFTYANQTDNYQQDYYQFFIDHKFNNNWSASIANFLTRGKGYYEEFKNNQSFSSYGLAPFVSPSKDTFTTTNLIRQLWLDNYFYGSLASVFYQKNNSQITIGSGYTQYDGRQYGFVKWAQYGAPNDYRWYFNTSTKTDFNTFIKCQQQLGKLSLYGDVQLRTVHYEINGFRNNPDLKPSNNYTFFNPKFGLSYRISSTSLFQKIYGSVAIANKEPNHDDFEAAKSEQPKPEQLTDYEIGYEAHTSKWSAHANAFYMNYKDQLVLTGKLNDVGVYVRTNVPQSFRSGIELMAGYQFTSWLRLNANATFSQNKIKDFTEFVDDYDNGGQQAINHGTTDIAFSPNQIYSANLHLVPFRHLHFWRHFSIDLIQKQVSKQYLDNTSNEHRIINPYGLTDCRIQFAIKTKMVKELGCTLALNNFFNKLYESNGYTYSYIYGQTFTTQNFYYPQAGFNWMMGVSIKL